MDREADVYPLFVQIHQAGLRFIIRLCQDRLVAEEERTLHEALERAPLRATREVPLSRRRPSPFPKERKRHPPREYRRAKLSISSRSLTFQKPKKASDKTLPPSMRLNVVYVKELDPPSGEDPICWRLCTTEPIETEEQVLKVVDAYRARWVIEEFFKALKTGCAYEERQVETCHALLNALSVFVPIAWRLLRLRHVATQHPKRPAVEIFPSHQLDLLRRLVFPSLSDQPTAAEAMAALAQLGGHLKHNGPPGWQVLSRGYEYLLQIEVGWFLALTPSPRETDL